MLIYNLTLDQTRHAEDENRVHSYRNHEFIRCEQVLTESGICYVTNNLLATNLSAMYENGRF